MRIWELFPRPAQAEVSVSFLKNELVFGTTTLTFAGELSVVLAGGLVPANDALDVLVLVDPVVGSSALGGVRLRAGSRRLLQFPAGRDQRGNVLGLSRSDRSRARTWSEGAQAWTQHSAGLAPRSRRRCH